MHVHVHANWHGNVCACACAYACAFLCHHESKWLEACPLEYKPIIYMWMLFACLPDLLKLMNRYHINSSSTGEVDIMTSRKGSTLETSLYRKPTFSGVFSNFNSFIPTNNKRGLSFTLLLLRAFMICCNYKNIRSSKRTRTNILLHHVVNYTLFFAHPEGRGTYSISKINFQEHSILPYSTHTCARVSMPFIMANLTAIFP